MKPMNISDMENRLQALQAGFSAMTGVLTAIAAALPNQARKESLAVLDHYAEATRAHFLNEIFPDSLIEEFDHYLKQFQDLLKQQRPQ